MGGAGFGGGVFFEEVADFEVEVWEVGGAAEPVVVGVDVGEGYDLAAFEGGEAVVELGFASGVEPVIWIDGDADGGLDTGVGDVCRHRDGFFAGFKRAR